MDSGVTLEIRRLLVQPSLTALLGFGTQPHYKVASNSWDLQRLTSGERGCPSELAHGWSWERLIKKSNKKQKRVEDFTTCLFLKCKHKLL